jgi:hypothetical protein
MAGFPPEGMVKNLPVGRQAKNKEQRTTNNHEHTYRNKRRYSHIN